MKRKVPRAEAVRDALENALSVGQGIMGMYLYDRIALTAGILSGEPDALFDTMVIGSTLKRLTDGECEVDCFLCGVGPLDDAELFVVVRPELDAIQTAERSGDAVVNCVCRACCAGKDAPGMLDRVFAQYQKIAMPGAQRVDIREGGRA